MDGADPQRSGRLRGKASIGMNEKLQRAVSDELASEPKIDHSAIAVSADDGGSVTLRGTVGSFRQKWEARRAAERVYGVQDVKNDLDVRIADDREDADLRGAVLQALTLDSLVPSTIDAKVDDGKVTLTGTATRKFERDEAEFIAGNVRGVRGIRSEIDLYPEPSLTDVKAAIEQGFKRNATLDANSLSVENSNGTVVLSGVVSSWFAHDAAVDAAWSAPGVTKVDDRIQVRY
jgi:osmotically-inducible protein OsmY